MRPDVSVEHLQNKFLIYETICRCIFHPILASNLLILISVHVYDA